MSINLSKIEDREILLDSIFMTYFMPVHEVLNSEDMTRKHRRYWMRYFSTIKSEYNEVFLKKARKIKPGNQGTEAVRSISETILSGEMYYNDYDKYGSYLITRYGFIKMELEFYWKWIQRGYHLESDETRKSCETTENILTFTVEWLERKGRFIKRCLNDHDALEDYLRKHGNWYTKLLFVLRML